VLKHGSCRSHIASIRLTTLGTGDLASAIPIAQVLGRVILHAAMAGDYSFRHLLRLDLQIGAAATFSPVTWKRAFEGRLGMGRKLSQFPQVDQSIIRLSIDVVGSGIHQQRHKCTVRYLI
jgi:hypothetical protein